ncbi:RsmE family RNA methyltransferase [Acetobacterium sp.]|uniref:RsmE family RNA methyltransferase n=1 Tax=Acetobacterium sp. TaxID=1872094 RepID=UPI002F40BE6E
MHRFFVNPNQINDRVINIDGEDFKHITKVLRLKKGEIIEVCDGMGLDFRVVLEAPGDGTIAGRITETSLSKGETTDMCITLFQGLPKGSKMEVIIQKSVELGVNRIVPFQSKRSVSQIKEKKDKKIERWQRIAYEAAKQSKRGIIPVIGELSELKDILQDAKHFDLLLLAYEDEKKQSLKEVLTGLCQGQEIRKPLDIGVIIGPEGGFDPTEVSMCQLAGVKSVSLGNRILRTETAGMVVLSQLNFWREG